MADIIDAEILGLQGRFSQRLARLARRFDHRIVAKTAFEAAHEAYEAWEPVG